MKEYLDESTLLTAFDEAENFQNEVTSSSLSTEVKNISERYETKSLIGEGALKKVFLAHDRLLDRDVALAKLKEGGNTDDFFHEARLASILKHSYISPIHDIGYNEDGEPFFVMELYEGKSLEGVSYGEFHLSELLNLFLKVCEAVSYAHSQGVLHLDLKPSNVRIDDFGGILLCDWGISRMITDFSESFDSKSLKTEIFPFSRSTLVGEVRGTPGFMAPEQKSRVECDKRTDVFGLGALLHDLLTGGVPGETKLDSQGIPLEIKAICRRALEEAPKDRYETVAELIKDIQNYNNGLVTSAENASILRVLKKWIIRHKTRAAFLLINVLTLIGLVLFYLSSINQKNIELSSALQDVTTLQKEQEKARVKLAEGSHSKARDLYKALGENYNKNNLDQAISLMELATKLNPANNRNFNFLGKLYVLRERYEDAIKTYKSDVQIDSLLVQRFLKESAAINNKKYLKSLKLIELFDELGVKDEMLRSRIILKTIARNTNIKTRLTIALKVMDILHKNKDITNSFDKNHKHLKITGPINRLIQFKNLDISHLSFIENDLKASELKFLETVPLVYLDLSYGSIKTLNNLKNPSIEELNLEGSDLGRLPDLKQFPVLKVLNIAKTGFDLDGLEKFKTLERLICSQDQADKLKSLLSPSIIIEVKK